jgi:hypothetical protein
MRFPGFNRAYGGIDAYALYLKWALYRWKSFEKPLSMA